MNKSSFTKIFLSLIFGTLILFMVFFAGLWIGNKLTINQGKYSESIIDHEPPTQSSVPNENLNQNLFDPFWQAWDSVHELYVDQPVDDTLLMQGAISGMMNSLGDPHSSYMDPNELQQANASLEGSYEGIGAWVDTSGQFLTIISPMAGSPAESAGLKPGDKIIAIDGVDQTGIDPQIVLRSVLGPAGSQVTLSIQRDNLDSTFDVTITRATIILHDVTGRILDGNIGYIQLSTFGENSAAELHEKLEELLTQNPTGLIFDLRGNTGGYLSTAVDVVSEFISEGTVLIEVYGNGTETRYPAVGGGVATNIPLVVLVNEGTASAAEITAGAIQDYGRGKLIGQTTYGKGSVQQWIELENDQGAIRVTVARWLTPNGRQIHGVGLAPDILVELTEEDQEAEIDPQLDRAVEEILNITQ